MPASIDKGVEVLNLHGGNPIYINLNVRKKLDKVLMSCLLYTSEDEYTVYEVDGSDTDEEADLLNFDDLDSDEFV